MKTILSVVVVLFFAVANITAEAAEITLKAAHNGSPEYAGTDGYLKMKEVIEFETNGLVEVQIFPSEQLGSEEQVNEMLQGGTAAFNAASAGGLAGFVPSIEVFNLPFIFRSADHMYRVIDGPVGRRLGQEIENKLDVVFFGWWYGGVRNVYNSTRPVMTPKDLKGLKIRTMNTSAMVDSFNALSAQATPMSFGELYTGLQQGVVDGAESDHVDLLIEKFYEVTKYVSMTGHMHLPIALIMSKKIYDDLPPHVQTAVWKGALASIPVQRAALDIKTIKALKELKKKDLKFNEVDKALFQAGVQDVYKKYEKQLGGAAVFEQIENQ